MKLNALIHCCVLTVYNTLYKFVSTQRDGLCQNRKPFAWYYAVIVVTTSTSLEYWLNVLRYWDLTEQIFLRKFQQVIDVCFIAASYVSLVRRRLPELHYEKRVGNAMWCSKLFTLGNVSLRKVLPNTKLWFAFVATVTSSKPEPVGVSFLRHRQRKLPIPRTNAWYRTSAFED